MTVRVYRSTDVGAPPRVTSVAGDMVNILDAVLDVGYNLAAISTLTRVGAVATITFGVDHGLEGINRVRVSGANESEYNGEFEVRVIGPNQVEYDIIGNPATPATGTIIASKDGAGWVKEHDDTLNRRGYRSAKNFYLYVDDTYTTAARFTGRETMNDFVTFTNEFPTSGQYNGGLYLPKSTTASGRDWIIVATENSMYIWVNQTGTLTTASISFFGECTSFYTGVDDYCIAIIGQTSTSPTTNNGVAAIQSNLTTSNYNYMARSYDQQGSSIAINKNSDKGAMNAASYAGVDGITYPDPVTGDLSYSDIYLNEKVEEVRRGKMPGILCPLHARPLTHLDTFEGSGDYAGKTFLVLDVYSSGQIFLEISNTW